MTPVVIGILAFCLALSVTTATLRFIRERRAWAEELRRRAQWQREATERERSALYEVDRLLASCDNPDGEQTIRRMYLHGMFGPTLGSALGNPFGKGRYS